MKITVIIPVYNCELYLNKCINSVLTQTFQDFEIILINNGSLDSSAQICASYADEDYRINYVQKENTGGAGEPRNKGLDLAKGEYIVFLDADDYLPSDALEILYNEAISMDYDCVIGSYRNFSEDSMIDYETILEERELIGEKEVRDYFSRIYPDGEAGYLWNKIYKRDIIEHYEVRFPSMQRLEDGFFNVDYFSHVDKCKVIGQIVYNYKLNAQTDLFKKSPPNYYDLVKTLTMHYYATIDKWGYNPEDVEGEVVKFFLNELEVCFENTSNPVWDMDRIKRINYFNSLQNDVLVQYMIQRKKYVGRYVRRVMRMFKNRHYGVMMLFIKLKLYTKKYLKGTFKIIKRIFN